MSTNIYEIIDSFDVTPNTNLLDVLGHSGYSLQSAIADIIDNSITAKAKNIWIEMNYNSGEPFITIIDDGIGMSLDRLKQASIIAFKNMLDERSRNDLGRFSTGLNSASASMCDRLMIQSKEINGNKNTLLLDYELMRQNGWICSVISYVSDHIHSSSGTAIVWNKLKDIAKANCQTEFFSKIAIVEKHLSHVFSDYINKNLNIIINGNKIISWDPFFSHHTKTTLILDEVIKYHNSKIGIKIYILPPSNNLSTNDQAYMRGYGLSDQQGFYIFRNNRLIKEGGWLGFDDLSISNKYDYSRIRIDIDSSLDLLFNPNFLKNEIFIPDDLLPFLKKIATKARNESRKSFNYMKAPSIVRITKTETHIPVWHSKITSDGILLSVNEDHPIIKSIVASMKEIDKNRLFKLLSKNIPIGEISRSGISKKQNTYSNLSQEMNDMYERLKEDGFSNTEIMKKMSSCEPFCLDDNYISDLIDFFESKGVL